MWMTGERVASGLAYTARRGELKLRKPGIPRMKVDFFFVLGSMHAAI